MTISSQENYYDILHVSPSASTLGIINAYREAKLIFQDSSLAAYSLYSAEEIDAINQQIDEAYAILSNSETRRTYDETHNFTNPNKHAKPQDHQHVQKDLKDNNELSVIQPSVVPNVVCGKVLKELRESNSLSLEHIANKTNISLAYLKAIETDDASIFPGMFYFKSYLKQYASCIGLEPCLTWERYQKNLKD